MELFAAGNEEQLQVIRRWIDESDIFMLILGKRYGSIEPKTGLSYIELEYEYALSSNKPFFAIVLNEKFIDKKIRDGQSTHEILESSQPDKFKVFREKVTARLCAFVEDEKDIRLAVAASIRDLERRHQFIGWVSGRAAEPNSKLVADLGAATQLAAALQEKNASLEKENEKLHAREKEREVYDGRTSNELYQLLKSRKITLRIDEDQVETTVLIAATQFKSKLALGVDNSTQSTHLDIDLYYGVASELMAYGLAQFGKSPSSAAWQRIILSPSDKRFLNECEAKIMRVKENRNLQKQEVPSLPTKDISPDSRIQPKGDSEAVEKK